MATLQRFRSKPISQRALSMRTLFLIFFLTLPVVTSCGSSSSSVPINFCKGYTVPQERSFLRDRLVITLQMPNDMPPNLATDEIEIQQSLQKMLDGQQTGSPSLVPIGTVSNMPSVLVEGNLLTLSYQLTNNDTPNSYDGCDYSLSHFVNAVDTKVNPSSVNATANPLTVSTADGTFTVLGVSPDWMSTGSGGSDDTRGQPGGPAQQPASPPFLQTSDFTLPQSDFNPVCNNPNPCPTTIGMGGSGTAVIVLDTAYPTQSNRYSSASRITDYRYPATVPHQPMQCDQHDTTGLSCIPPAQPLSASPDILADYNAGSPDPLSQLVQSKMMETIDMALPTDQPDQEATGTTGPIGSIFGSSGTQSDSPNPSTPPIIDIDHGLFVSSLIHDIAPLAAIRLVRVLNDYNVGDAQTLQMVLNALYYSLKMYGTAGFNDPFHLPSGMTQLIINFSGKVGPNPACENMIWKQTMQGGSNISCTPNNQVDGSDLLATASRFGPLETAMDQLETLGQTGSSMPSVTIVAAAGNGGSLYPDIPAFFCGVRPVGSADSNDQTAVSSFSNAVIPPFSDINGYTVIPCLTNKLGNPTAANGFTPNAQIQPPTITVSPTFNLGVVSDSSDEFANGVCGIYLQPINGSDPQMNHYLALWAGTSFAAPIFAGALAGNLNSSIDTNETGNALIHTFDQPCRTGGAFVYPLTKTPYTSYTPNTATESPAAKPLVQILLPAAGQSVTVTTADAPFYLNLIATASTKAVLISWSDSLGILHDISDTSKGGTSSIWGADVPVKLDPFPPFKVDCGSKVNDTITVQITDNSNQTASAFVPIVLLRMC